jgi:hypothetical protein
MERVSVLHALSMYARVLAASGCAAEAVATSVDDTIRLATRDLM